MWYSLDTETTGVDLYHGARPFLVTFCDEEGVNTYFEWDVDPLTRQPIIEHRDLTEIRDIIYSADRLVLQNSKFDSTALHMAFCGKLEWPWSKVHDTLIAGHLLASNHPHDLSSMAVEYLGVNIDQYEDRMYEACAEARRVARKDYPEWRIANRDLPEMPSARGKVWKFDMWLLRAIATEKNYDPEDDWWSIVSDYANMDSAVTLPLFRRQEEILKERDLWDIYQERMKVVPVAEQMERHGITLNAKKVRQLQTEYRKESERSGRICVNVAKSFGYKLELPQSGNNKSLREFCFGKAVVKAFENGEWKETNDKKPKPGVSYVFSVDKSNCLNLKSPKVSKKTGDPSLDKAVLEHFEATLPTRSRELTFIRSLKAKRKRDTAVNYMEAYKRFWRPLNGRPGEWKILHPNLNITGTDTLRWSSSNPNEQNISKQEGFNLRYVFGPAPGREWWSLDAKNIELRLPAYEAEEREMIDLFERPDEPPYYGSYHLLVFDILHPEKFARHGTSCKKIYESTWYQWTKNGNFAVQYGAVESSGTADRAYHMPGAQRKVQERFGKIAELNRKMIKQANRFGYVETIPDKTVNPRRGYPLLCSRSDRGTVLPTIPLNYHIQGTAMWWMMKSMIRCSDYLDRLNQRRPGKDYRMILQVHDELVFDFPKGDNLPIVKTIKRLMEKGGDDIGIPTPVSMEHHPNNWSAGTAA